MDGAAAEGAAVTPTEDADAPYYWLGRLSTSLSETIANISEHAYPMNIDEARAVLREYDAWLQRRLTGGRAKELHLQGEIEALERG